ncbi:hypothetical protein EJ02DRAFT_410122 [Clathrospora elynae]|uniref:RBR-type E3 ubiquitin transferase n=1 Tax=Clathrospora elynae TaxID=706981 RepID=A0A6A5SES6_9PLEO|nr:hypothetical protein EJ02DRAFT_410122 [Clathrospora elynae]
MGSKLSKVRSHVKAPTSAVALAQLRHDSDSANAKEERQEAAPRLPNTFAATNMEQASERAAAFELFLVEHNLMSMQYGDIDPTPPPTNTMPPPPPPAQWQSGQPPLGEPDVECIICCMQLPSKDPKYVKEVIEPCRSCNSAYCASCVKNMFINACKDTTRMPPRCCVQIQLHHARPFLSKEEIAEFKAKYEEWHTPKPFYCPKPICSAFIPERLIPEHARTSNKSKRIDSGIGTPTPTTFACPTCEASICADCRQTAHPNCMCNVTEFGIDTETSALLKSWGYKQCPKCGHGLKKMFGCSHMECRCGAHFCYRCMLSREECAGECYEDDEDEESDAEPDEIDEPIPEPVAGSHVPQHATAEVTTPPSTPTDEPRTATPPQAIPRPRNLDGGGQRYWEEQELNFGDEPTEDIQDRSWSCRHDFSTYKITLAKAIANDPSVTEMECVKCWCAVHPEIEAPKSSANTLEKTVPSGVGGSPRGILRGLGRGRGRGRGRFVPPRGLFRADTTIGTAPHLTTTISSPLSQSAPVRETLPMEDVQYKDCVVDTYGNIIATTEPNVQRRASEDDLLRTLVSPRESTGEAALGTPSHVFTTTTCQFSFAHECDSCGLLVCASCKDITLAT